MLVSCETRVGAISVAVIRIATSRVFKRMSYLLLAERSARMIRDCRAN